MEISQQRRDENNLHFLMDKITAYSFGLGDEFIEFRHVMEPFPNPILITTTEPKIIYANPAWEKLTGYHCVEVQGKNPNLLQSGKTSREVFYRLWSTLRHDQSFTSEEIINKRKDGTEYQVQSTIFPIKKNGRTLFYVQVTQDITARKKIDDLKKEFLSAATHELKTPITTLKLLTESQIRKLENNRNLDIKEFRIVNRELDRLTRLINDLSDVARVETGKLNLIFDTVNITQVITDVIRQMEMVADCHVLIQKYTEPLYVIADEDRIKQVLINLVKNAIKFSPIKSTIMIDVAQEKKQVIISVKDEGEGISKEQISHIFDRFYQIHTNFESGFGLGLYIAKEIITQHKGKIWVTSRLGHGSTFFFSLQLAK